MLGNDSGTKGEGLCNQSVTFCSFLTTGFLMDFLVSTTESMCCCQTHTHTQIFSSMPSRPLSVPLPQKCILLLISWLHICLLVVFFSLSIKHLLLLVWNVTLHIVCRLSVGADLEGPVWTITLQLSPRAVIKHTPSA